MALLEQIVFQKRMEFICLVLCTRYSIRLSIYTFGAPCYIYVRLQMTLENPTCASVSYRFNDALCYGLACTVSHAVLFWP